MEYWKNEHPTQIFCNFKQRTSRIYDALSSRAIYHHSSTPILHHSLKLLQAEPIVYDLAQLPAHRAYSPAGRPGFQR